ncbi:hypothetical protein Y032_0311g2148 [Ancylostoma ceylanicum]|uniref:Endonuclease/exonuclease/phosphatase domain-containing protein n=1 Tax=Ancylostoma ceylanicum TaxID=53326 RepID=A0A016S3A6_9BILA|nr:hypothetical protein Y032_0311g2148 [Ancylostoma ceylanicum]
MEIAHNFSRTKATASGALADASTLADYRDQGADEELNTCHTEEKKKGKEKRQKIVTRKRLLKIASWNIRTGHHVGQKENVIRDLLRYGISIAVLQELRITGTGCTRVTSPDSNDWMMLYYSGGEHHIEGVGFTLDQRTYNCVVAFQPIPCRITVLPSKALSERTLLQSMLPQKMLQTHQKINSTRNYSLLSTHYHIANSP